MNRKATELTTDQQIHLAKETDRINGFGEDELREHHRNLLPLFVQQYVQLSGDRPHAEYIDMVSNTLNGCFAEYYRRERIEDRRQRVIYLQHMILVQHNILQGFK